MSDRVARGSRRSLWRETVDDLIYVAMGVVFFVVALAYVAGAEGLMWGTQ